MSEIPPGPPVGTGVPPEFDPADIDQHRTQAMLAYILFIIPLLWAPRSPFARFHASQSLNLFIATVSTWLALCIVWVVGHWIPLFNCCLSAALGLAGLMSVAGAMGLALLGIVNAANGQARRLPIVGNMIDQIRIHDI